MSERDNVLPAPAGLQTFESASSGASHADTAVAQATAGALLREAREQRGLDIESLAAMLKVSVQKLQALEHDQFDLLVDPVFARALASSMCRVLGIDSQPILQRLPAITAFKVTTQNRGINAPFRPRETASGSSLRFQLSRPAILLGLALLLGALVLILLPFVQQEIAAFRGQDQDQSVSSTGELVEPVVTTTTLTGPVPAGNEAVVVAPNPPGEPLPFSAAQTALSAPVALAPASSAAANAGNAITFSATGESWVKVTDAKGEALLNRKLTAGEVVGVSGAAPLKVTVGRADALQVQVRGQPFGLNAVAKNNIARFEVK